MDASLQSRAELLAREIAGQARTIEDVNELMQLMMKSALERMLDTEMEVHLGRRPVPELAEESAGTATDSLEPAATETPRKAPNRRNGRSKKTVRSDNGELTIAPPGPRRHL